MHTALSPAKSSTQAAAGPQAPLTEQAFARLRADLLGGAVAPGDKLKVEELQARYGFSSSPLREALSRLAQEGLVRADERRGFRAASISPADLADITHMRLMLDPPALASAIAAGDDAWEAAIVAAFHRLERRESRLPDGPAVLDDDWGRLHRDFHFALLAACPSARQLQWSASLFDQAERYRRYSALHRTQPRRKSQEHRRLMEAVLRRDADKACSLLAEHIRSTQRNVLGALAALAPA
jgi:DNA-binding GntR family transcriptional regulator